MVYYPCAPNHLSWSAPVLRQYQCVRLLRGDPQVSSFYARRPTRFHLPTFDIWVYYLGDMEVDMEFIKWLAILIYWIWLDIRNSREYSKRHDWKLIVQIIINTAVIAIIIIEGHESLIRLLVPIR